VSTHQFVVFVDRINQSLLDSDIPTGTAADHPVAGASTSLTLELEPRNHSHNHRNAASPDSEGPGRPSSSVKRPRDVDHGGIAVRNNISGRVKQAGSYTIKNVSAKQVAATRSASPASRLATPPLSIQCQMSLGPDYQTEPENSSGKLSSGLPSVLVAPAGGRGLSVDQSQDHVSLDIPKTSPNEILAVTEANGRGKRRRMKTRRYDDNFEAH